jgi:hypothetical protein
LSWWPQVLVIDEAYLLAKSSYGQDALDVLVERVQGPGDDFVVVLCGYEKQMRDMFREGNPGLARRFRLETAMKFSDYSDDELVEIALQKSLLLGMNLTRELAAAAVRYYLAPQRSRPNFGNGGAVHNLLSTALIRANKRCALSGKPHVKVEGRITLEREDLLGTPIDPLASPALRKLKGMPGLIEVKAAIDQLVKLTSDNFKAMASDEAVHDVSLHRCFLGNPGTGKTTVATLYGQLLCELGFLSSGEVIVIGASKLTGDVVGSAAKNTNAIMDSARGKVGGWMCVVCVHAYSVRPSKLCLLIRGIVGSRHRRSISTRGHNLRQRSS